jgi:predicted  nucleic acid-binding Zn-ribbon protein
MHPAGAFFLHLGEEKLRTQIEILAALQIVDREIREHAGVKRGLATELQEKERFIQERKQEFEALMAACAAKEKLRQEKDRMLQEEGKKAADKRMRMNRIKNVKELQALQREIDQIRQANGEAEEELLNMMVQIDEVKGEIKTKQEALLAAQQDWQQKKEALQAQIAAIDQAVDTASIRRQSIAAEIAADLMSRYELILSRRGGTAVVEVTGGICQGCYMNIPPQLWNELIRSEKVNLCPSCQRIVYYKAPEAQEKTA